MEQTIFRTMGRKGEKEFFYFPDNTEKMTNHKVMGRENKREFNLYYYGVHSTLLGILGILTQLIYKMSKSFLIFSINRLENNKSNEII